MSTKKQSPSEMAARGPTSDPCAGVEVRLRRHADAGYEQVARLVVRADGEVVVDDPEQMFPFDVPVMTGTGPVRWDEDRLAWARSLDAMYRSGYLVAQIVELGDREALSPRS